MQRVKINAGISDNYTGALVDDLLGGVKYAHDDIPCVCHNEDGKGAFENPAEEHGWFNSSLSAFRHSYSAREMVTISRGACPVISSVFHG